MTPEHVTLILALAAALDPRFNTVDADQAQARVVAWCDVLQGVEPKFALDHVRRFYRSEQKWPVQPGAIRTAWRHELDRRDSVARTEQLRAAQPRELTEAAQAAIERGRQAIADARTTMQETRRERPRPW